MDKYSTLGMLCKREIKNHSEKLCEGLSRPKQKLVGQVLYGLLHSQSCKLTEIGRALKEKIELKKTVERLRLGLFHLSEEQREHLMENHLSHVRACVDESSILIVDNSDITKAYSQAQEGLCPVRDGDTGEIGQGYHTLEVAALSRQHRMPVPVYSRIYSSIEDSFVSENEEILTALRMLSQQFGGLGVRTMDRGYDALSYYEYFFSHNEPFVIRCKKNRDVVYKGKTQNILVLANMRKGKYRLDYQTKNGRKCCCKVSFLPVSLPKYPNERLQLVVVHGFGKDPMMLLTNLPVSDGRICLTISKVYLLRWKIEEYFRFKKQQFHFEDIRVRSLDSIRSLNAILTCLVGLFARLSEKIGSSMFLAELIVQARRVDSIFKSSGRLKFLFYTLACAFSSLLRMSHKPLGFPPRRSLLPASQLSFL